MNIALCFCVRNCEQYLEGIFKNIESIKTLPVNIYCIFIYDNCKDNSAVLLKNYETQHTNVIVKEIQNKSPYRTLRISKARNTCLGIIYNHLKMIQYHIMIDCDDVCCNPWDLNVLSNTLNNVDNDDWDSISFNRDYYYDIWALMFDAFNHHCWGYGMNSRKVIEIMRSEIVNKLKTSTTNSIQVISAFNGFCIYKTDKFKDVRYEGLYYNLRQLITEYEVVTTIQYLKKYGVTIKLDMNPNNECCEHLFYNLSAHKKGCKNKISKFNIVSSPPIPIQPIRQIQQIQQIQPIQPIQPIQTFQFSHMSKTKLKLTFN